MTPSNTLITTDLEISEEIMTTRTYDIQYDMVGKYIDGIEALRQHINKILSTEKYQYPIYSFNYGIELESLIGKDLEYIQIELKRRIEECLSDDSRIQSIENFVFESEADTLYCSFNVVSIYGDVTINKEVNV